MSDSHDIPLGLCQCGCGQKTRIPDKTNAKGDVAGRPRKYLRGHHIHGLIAEGKMCGRARIGPPIANENGCWIWQGHINEAGYGEMWRPDKQKAHRFYYEQRHGPIPAGYHIHHTCRTPACVNPEHLVALSVAQHKRLHPNRHGPFAAKLDPQRVRKIRTQAAAGESHSALAREFGVSRQAISQVVRRSTWADVL